MEQSRRDFFKGAGAFAAVTAAAAGLAGCKKEEEVIPPTFETKYDVDVVIAGAGIGGLAAAVSAVKEGASVVLVEASAKAGGTSRFAAGALGLRSGTDWEGVVKNTYPLSNEPLGKKICASWDDYVAWARDEVGATIEDYTANYKWMGGRRPAGQGSKSYTDEYLQEFAQAFVDAGGILLTSTNAVKVLTTDKGEACGLRVTDAEGAYEIAAKNVILATGGWQANKEMCTKYIGRHANMSQAQCVPYLNGGGIQMGVEVGARLSSGFGCFYGHPQPWPTGWIKGIDTVEGYEALADIDQAHLAYYGTTQQAIQGMGAYLNMQGKRFVNEGLGSSLVNQEVMQQQYARAYWIISQAQYESCSIEAYKSFFDAAVVGGNRIDNLRKMGATIIEGATVEELMANIKASFGGAEFNVANAVKTIAEYNAAAEAGTLAAMEIPHTYNYVGCSLAEGPYYAIPVVAGIMATFGGLLINTDAEVIGMDNKPIPHLYAVPGCAGGIMDGDYWCVMSGYSVMGRIAGLNAAANK